MSQLAYHTARFEAAFGTVEQLPESTTPEVAVAGRSNVGKSSLLNRLFQRKALAKVSSVPGKTATINFYEVDGVRFVDLPGYGFAKVGKKEKERWVELIGGYFAQERSFNLVLCLVDIRHDAQKLDQDMLSYVQQEKLPYLVVLTKADKLSRAQQDKMRARLARGLRVPRERMILTSSETGLGIDQLKVAIEEACL